MPVTPRPSRWPGVGQLGTPAGIVGLVTIMVAAWAAALLVNRVGGLAAPPYDLAFFNQIIWNLGNGEPWTSSFHEGSFLGLHFSPILVVPAAISRVVGPDVRVLNLLHALAVAALVASSFLFLRAMFRPSRFGPSLAAVLAIGVPMWGTTQEVIRSDFHPEAAGICLALLAGWAGLTGRHRAMWAFAALALATREDVGYAVAVVGLAVAARGRGPARRHGRVLVVVAIAWTAVVFALVMPAFRDGVRTDTDRYYAWLGSGLSVLVAPFTRTDTVIAYLSRPAPWLAGAGMIIATLGLALARPRWLLLALPPMIAVLLSSNRFQANLLLQYALVLVVPLLVATGFGGRRVLALVERRWRRSIRASRVDHRRAPARRLSVVLAALLLVPAAAGAWVQGSLPPFSTADPAFGSRPAGLDQVRATARVVPGDALLTADEGLVAPLSGRARIRRLTAGPVPPASYVVMEREAWSPSSRARRQHDELLVALLAGDRAVLVDDGRFIVWGPEPGEVAP